ncbi:Hypothetical predicted protein [Paramuricea clavata]|uniref:Uncharacterized protein n=1 Tax=Paramuricea clavata TaxID=317549 RepID=A0A6S7G4P7_PARCT|nr:Hypothetical predicted protein [Paramuricea clavata]
MEKEDYMQLIHGRGIKYNNSNLLYLPNKGKTTEERALDNVSPPTNLKPNYVPDKKVRRVGQLPPQVREARTSRVDSTVLRKIYG